MTEFLHSTVDYFFHRCNYLYGSKSPYNYSKKCKPHNLSEYEFASQEWCESLLNTNGIWKKECLKAFVHNFHLYEIYSERPPTFYEFYNCFKGN